MDSINLKKEQYPLHIFIPSSKPFYLLLIKWIVKGDLKEPHFLLHKLKPMEIPRLLLKREIFKKIILKVLSFLINHNMFHYILVRNLN